MKLFNLKIKGAKKLEKKFKRMERKTANKFMLASMKDAMQQVVPAAQSRVPVDTGLTKKHIKVATKNSLKKGLMAMVRTGTRRQMKIPKGAKYYYPAGLEYGTRRTKARSFLRTALGSLKTRVITDFGNNLDKSLRNA